MERSQHRLEVALLYAFQAVTLFAFFPALKNFREHFFTFFELALALALFGVLRGLWRWKRRDFFLLLILSSFNTLLLLDKIIDNSAIVVGSEERGRVKLLLVNGVVSNSYGVEERERPDLIISFGEPSESNCSLIFGRNHSSISISSFQRAVFCGSNKLEIIETDKSIADLDPTFGVTKVGFSIGNQKKQEIILITLAPTGNNSSFHENEKRIRRTLVPLKERHPIPIVITLGPLGYGSLHRERIEHTLPIKGVLPFLHTFRGSGILFASTPYIEVFAPESGQTSLSKGAIDNSLLLTFDLPQL